jgi:hypothetical protein
MWVLRRVNSVEGYIIKKSSLKTLYTLERGDMSAYIATVAPKGSLRYCVPQEQRILTLLGQSWLPGLRTEVYLAETLPEARLLLSHLPEPFRQTLNAALLGSDSK